MQLHILSPGMEKRRTNTTRYDGRMQTLQWHVEWRFPAAEGAKAADHKCVARQLCTLGGCVCSRSACRSGAYRSESSGQPSLRFPAAHACPAPCRRVSNASSPKQLRSLPCAAWALGVAELLGALPRATLQGAREHAGVRPAARPPRAEARGGGQAPRAA